MRTITTLVQLAMLSVALWSLWQSYALWTKESPKRFADVDELARRRRLS